MTKPKPTTLDPQALAAARRAFIDTLAAHYPAQLSNPPHTRAGQRALDSALLRAARALLAPPPPPPPSLHRRAELIAHVVKYSRPYVIIRTPSERYFAARAVKNQGFARVGRHGAEALPSYDIDHIAESADLTGPTYATPHGAKDAIRKSLILKRNKNKLK